MPIQPATRTNTRPQPFSGPGKPATQPRIASLGDATTNPIANPGLGTFRPAPSLYTGPARDHFMKSRPHPAGLATRPAAPPRFSGLWATRTAALGQRNDDGFFGTWPLTGKQLKNIATIDDDPYVGQSPIRLQVSLGLNHAQLCDALDDLAESLRPDPELDTPIMDRIIESFHSPTETRMLNGHPVTLKKVGEGSFGVVYRLSDGENTYAFKVHREKDRFYGYPDHSPFQEAATGQYLTAHNINKDVVRFYVSNPDLGWNLTEFVTPYANRNRRSGKTMHEAGIALSDERYNNRIGHVRVDLGGALRACDPNSPPEEDWDSFY